MKSILETSVYLLIAAFICYIGIDFVSINMKVSKINEISQYMRDYIEVYGKAEIDVNGSYIIDSNTISAIRDKAQENNMMIEYEYTSSTEDYIYYDLYVSYNLRLSVLGFQKNHVYNSLVRVAA